MTGERICARPDYGWVTDSQSGPASSEIRLVQRPIRHAQGAPATTRLANFQAPALASAHVRIRCSDGIAGSGTLVYRGEKSGLVLTCAHLFDGNPEKIIVEFPNGKRFAARLLNRDEKLDLAAVAIRRPEIEPILVDDGDPAGELAACGYGQTGEFRSVHGGIVGEATAMGAAFASLMIGAEVRPGDSGGAVLNAAGRLVGVVWGKHDGNTYAMCGQPVREFVSRILTGPQDAKLPSTAAEPPIPRPEPPSLPPPPLDPRAEAPVPEIDLRAWASEIESRVRALDSKKQDKGEYLRPGDLASLATRDEVAATAKELRELRSAAEQSAAESNSRLVTLGAELRSQLDERLAQAKQGLLAGLSPMTLLAGALGLSGPLAAGIAAAAYLGRRWKKLGGGSLERGARSEEQGVATKPQNAVIPYRVVTVDTPPPPQRTVPETHYVPYEKDSYARAHQWASEQVVRKYPGATEVLQTQDSLIKQHLAAQ